ncbi:hypothetical protein [Amycolatopsis sp. NPDC021455]|uniref:hypothetical protein n=1 Tax=Amycolatopsis sp. NPDC021455 TaxID=3154901 RepID=UPI0033FD624E
MTGRIGTLTADYVAYGPAACAQASRLDTIARLELGAALDRALGDDGTVYVLRDVHAELTLRVDEPDAARRWAEALAGAVTETIDTDDGARVVTFPDEAAYLAAYLADHVRGEAAAHWYFATLRRFHHRPLAEVLPELFADTPADLVFAALHRQGRLAEVLAAVPVAVLAEVTTPAGPADDLAGLWPLLVAATRIADDWALWTSAPLTAPEVARRYRARPVPDWRDPVALTSIVLDVLRTLPETGRPAGPPPSSLAAELGWLDLPLLVRGLTGDRPVRRPAPRETAIRAEVRAVADRLGPIGTDPAAVLRLRAAVFAERPEWMDDPLVESVLAAVAVVDSVESECAGVLLFLRGVSDLRLPAVLARAGAADALVPALLAVAGGLSGAGPEDPAVAAFAGRPDDVEAETRHWPEIEARHGAAIRRELDAVLRGLRIDAPAGADLADALAQSVLAAWRRWLGTCAGLSGPDLLAHFARRPGRLSWLPRELRADLDASLLDVALRQAGYDQPIEAVPWLGDRRVSFRLVAR